MSTKHFNAALNKQQLYNIVIFSNNNNNNNSNNDNK